MWENLQGGNTSQNFIMKSFAFLCTKHAIPHIISNLVPQSPPPPPLTQILIMAILFVKKGIPVSIYLLKQDLHVSNMQ